MLKYRVPHGSNGLVVGSCTSHPGVLGSIPKREEPGKTGAPCVKVPGSSRVPCNRYCSNKHTHTLPSPAPAPRISRPDLPLCRGASAARARHLLSSCDLLSSTKVPSCTAFQSRQPSVTVSSTPQLPSFVFYSPSLGGVFPYPLITSHNRPSIALYVSQ